MKRLIILALSVFVCTLNTYPQQWEIDSLSAILKTTKEDTTRVKAYVGLCQRYQRTNPDTALCFANIGLELSKKTTYNKGQSDCYNEMGLVYYYRGAYDKALEHYLKSVKIFEESGDKKQMTNNCYNNIGNVHFVQGNYDKALEYYLKSLKIFEESGNKNGMSNCIMNIGSIHYIQATSSSDPKVRNEKYGKSIEFYLKALNFFEQISDSPDKATATIGKKGMAKCYNNIGNVHYHQGSYSKAQEFFLKSLEIREDLGDKEGIANVYGNMAYLNILLADSVALNENQRLNYLTKAVEYGTKAIELAQEIKAIPRVNEVANTLITAYKKLGSFEKSLKYAELFIATKDSMFKEEKTNALADMEGKYQNETKQKEIELLNKDKELQNIEVRSQKMQKYGFIAGFALMLVLAYVIFRNYRTKKKANELLCEKNAEISQQKEEIQTQAEQLERTNIELEKLSIAASKTDNSIVIAGKDGTIEWTNDGFTRLFGYTLSELITLRGSTLVTASNFSDIKEVMASCLNEKKSVTYTAMNRKKSGEKIWVQTTVTPIVDKLGSISKLIAIDADITKLKEAEEEITGKNELLAKTNTELENKNIQILDSISYAKVIQDAILPAAVQIKATFADSLVFFKPRDIVSGDFYWLSEKDNFIYFALVDCTGHGVPGAFMSMIGNTLLNEIVAESNDYTPAQVLGKLEQKVQYTLTQGGDSITGGDGMDISLCRVSKQTNDLLISGANQTVFAFTAGCEVKEITGNRFSIGTIFRKKRTDGFTDHSISTGKGTALYLFTDGFTDQFSDDNSVKFTIDRLKKLLSGIQNLDMAQQLKCISTAFDEWKGNNRQFDDVTIVGMKI